MTVFVTEQLFFVHVPKTAGTTVRHFMESHFAPDAIFPSSAMIEDNPPIYLDTVHFTKNHIKRVRGALLVRGHYRYHEIRAMMDTAPVTLTMLRNPIRRALSEMYHHRRHGDEIFRTISLETMVHDHPQCYLPQWMYFGKTLDEAIQTIESFDWVGIQEMFEPSMSSLCDTLGWNVPKTWKQENIMPVSQEEPISLSVLDMLHERLQDDMEFYMHARKLAESKQDDLVERVA